MKFLSPLILSRHTNEMKQMSWIEKYPKRALKEDLIGIKFVLNAEKEPKQTGFKNMLEVVICESADTSKAYRILATISDVDEMVRAYEQSLPFTFRRNEGERYANAVVVG